MMKIFIIACVVAFIVAVELPGMIREKAYKQIAVFTLLLGLGTTYLCDSQFHLSLPNPTKGITALMKPLMELLERVLI